MKLEFLALDSLTPYEKNPRKTKNLEVLEKSLEGFGFVNPIIAYVHEGKNMVLGGHQRIKAAKKQGIETVPVLFPPFKDWEHARAYIIMDNRASEVVAGWDQELLKMEVQELKLGSFDLNLTGFNEQQVFRLLEDSGSSDDEVPRPKDTVYTEVGDLYEIDGVHRVLCADSSDQQAASELFTDKKFNLLLTDPPYGVSYVGKTKDALTIQSDDLEPNQLRRKVAEWFDTAESVQGPGAYWLCTIPAGPLMEIFMSDLLRRGILRQNMVWVKDSMVLGRSEYHYQHEPILFGWNPQGQRLKNHDRKKTTVWNFARPKVSKEHPTMKPVAMWEYAIRNHTKKQDIVFDLFLGSGTTIIAAENLKRICYGIEIDPKYVDVIISRYHQAHPKAEIVRNGTRIDWAVETK